MPHDFTLTTVPVAGGDLTVATTGPADAPAVVALHGLGSTHRVFSRLAADAHERYRLIVPDLRGRGGSADLAGPWGFDAHLSDVIAVLDAFEVTDAAFIGHSMGAYLELVVSAAAPDRVRGLVLVDGGLPESPANAGMYAAISARAHRNLAALFDTVFPSPEAYLEAGRSGVPEGVLTDAEWEAEMRYVLTETPGGFRVRGALAAVKPDTDHIESVRAAAALRALNRPAVLLSAARGMVPGQPGIYSDRELAEWTAVLPSLRTLTFPDLNHASVMVDAGARAAMLDELDRILA